MMSATWLRENARSIALLFAALVLAFGVQAAIAAPAAAPVVEAPAAEAPAAATEAAPVDAPAPADASGYTPLGPDMIKGQPTAFEDDALASMTFQEQHNELGEYALWMHDAILLPVITVISLFVLGLLLFVIARFRRGANPEPSKTTHNTLIEVVWTVIPIIILLVIAVPSITLLARQYESPPADAVTVKLTGYQWYWGYTYPDQGVGEFVSNMLTEEQAKASGEPHQLAVDNRMVVPVGVPIRLQTTAADVIHSFAVPSLWFKLDAVPGRINEKMLQIDEPGIYYGQCSELCGARHGYMPIAVEAVPLEQWKAWVRSQGGSFPEDAPAAAPAAAEPAAPAAAAPAAAATPAE
ncbi:cytochrome c oxidase subunit II [Erythrobacter sp. SDW2]|uniref:cytochrome c oxidase subunit II n=1 Tax=Erythrobacter sp. SDW2 TaxID=2907154 RepID=UPI001F2E05F5|nr:cytochrome c oxidase subunit II [Erythrobacter sp. SDW2]UIP06303.1 cytochrome c oxidase subunit II [Erythrobacter sp. SDW2]